VGAAAWLAGTAELAARRIVPGPRDRREIATMIVTSAAIPFAATVAWAGGWVGARRALPRRSARGPVDAVLFDRDGTLIVDVPYNGDPARVAAMPRARESLDRLRRRGFAVGVVTNQSGVGRGSITSEQMHAVNERVESLLGPFAAWAVCPHAPEDGCPCRKPAPSLVNEAARRLGVPTSRCVVIGDIGSDIGAATAAGARAILVPTAATRPDEVARATMVAPDLPGAVDLVLALGSGR
jgi:histidinol-phosphate phosphatase family protein